jgi:hypothetical protein
VRRLIGWQSAWQFVIFLIPASRFGYLVLPLFLAGWFRCTPKTGGPASARDRTRASWTV